jgi:hypothetical protein
MFRAFQTQIDGTGKGQIDVSPYIESVEWDIYTVAIQTQIQNSACIAELHQNGFFLCASSQGSKDTATGPPDVVILPNDTLSILWFNATPNDTATAGVWYNENPKSTTYSSAH